MKANSEKEGPLQLDSEGETTLALSKDERILENCAAVRNLAPDLLAKGSGKAVKRQWKISERR